MTFFKSEVLMPPDWNFYEKTLRRIREAIFIDKVKDKNMNQDRGLDVSQPWLNLLNTR